MSTGRRVSRSPVVLPSSELDAHLHTTAAQITKKRESKVAWNCVEDDKEGCLSNSCHGDDLMIPPAVLLQMSMREAEKANDNKEASDLALEHWIRCTALARIVHGDSHWMLAKTHIQLARAYQQKKELHEQALIHATKGRDILISPSGHMTSSSHDCDPQPVYQLSLAHCIIGKALTNLGKLSEAERALIKAEKCSERYSKMSGSGGADVHLDLEIVAGMGQLSLQQKKYDLARNCLMKAIDYTKAAHGTTSDNLIPLLRLLATAELQTSNSNRAIELLQEAYQIAKHNHGVESIPVADILMCLARTLRAATAVDKESDESSIEEKLEQALDIYTSIHGPNHKTTIACKDELCQLLSLKKDSIKRAEEVVKEVIVAKKKTFGDSSLEVGHSYKLLGTLALSGGKISQARKYLEKAQHVYSLSYGAKHKETQSVARALEVIAESGGQTLPTKKPIFKTTV